MSKERQNNGFQLKLGEIIIIPEGVARYFRVPHSNAKFGKSLPLVAFLQELPLKLEERWQRRCGRKIHRYYRFIDRNTEGKGLKCFLPLVKSGDIVQIVMTYIKHSGKQSVAMCFLDQSDDFVSKYKNEKDLALIDKIKENRGSFFVSNK